MFAIPAPLSSLGFSKLNAMLQSDIRSGQFLGNPPEDWLVTLLVLLVLYQGGCWLIRIISRQLHRNKTLDNLPIIQMIELFLDSTSHFFILVVSAVFASQFLTLTTRQSHNLGLFLTITFLIQLGLWGKNFVDYKFARLIESKSDVEEKQQLSSLVVPVKFAIFTVLWSLLFLATLDNMGINVTALITGLGIGGIAVALAVQSTLADLIAALSIAFDKPFIVGDFIITGDFKGTVEKIGLKSTRLRSLWGEELILPNQDLLKSRIQNYKRMQERRIEFKFSLHPETPIKQLKEIPELIRDIIRNAEYTRFDRSHLSSFNDTGFLFETIYYVLDSDYTLYMNIQQAINLTLLETFKVQNIKLAYITPPIHLHIGQDKNNPPEAPADLPA